MRLRREVGCLCEFYPRGMRCRFCKHEEKERAAPAAQFGRSDVSFTAFEGDDDEPLGNPSAGEMFRELG